jgi:hypothetical protein
MRGFTHKVLHQEYSSKKVMQDSSFEDKAEGKEEEKKEWRKLRIFYRKKSRQIYNRERSESDGGKTR